MLNLDRAMKAIKFMLRNETHDYDKKPHKPVNEGDGKEYTWIGLTKEDDEHRVPPPYKTLWDLYELSKTDMKKAIGILIAMYQEGYWSNYHDEITDERFAIRYFDLGVNMGHRGVGKVLEATLARYSTFLPNKVAGLTKAVTDIINLMLKNHGDEFLKAFKEEAEKRYESFGNFDKFGAGWINRLNKDEYNTE